MHSEVLQIDASLATVWIANDNQPLVNYSYGGTRMVQQDTSESSVLVMLDHLMFYESALKNRLINKALEEHALDTYKEKLPSGFLESKVGGARCLIRPKEKEIADILANPAHVDFTSTISLVMKEIGSSLNKHKGKIKLTPDFGHYAGVSDILAKYTEHVLGISCDNGGCGGKTSYSSTGVIAAFQAIGGLKNKHIPITLIGSAGAMGTDVLNFLVTEGFTDIAIADTAYAANPKTQIKNLTVLPAKYGIFTKACLQRGGIIIATTVGHELENSSIQNIPSHTKVILAHNLAIPTGKKGIILMEKLRKRDILALPGQLVTLGGALTSRLEWFWRQSNKGKSFDKLLAHAIVKETVTFLTKKTLSAATAQKITPFEAMLQYANIL